MPFHRMTALIFLAFSAIQGTHGMAAGAPGIDLGAWRMDADSAIASTALPPSGAFELDASTRPTILDAASGAVNPVTGGSHLRKLLADFSMTLQNIRFRRGGRAQTGLLRADQDAPALRAGHHVVVRGPTDHVQVCQLGQTITQPHGHAD